MVRAIKEAQQDSFRCWWGRGCVYPYVLSQ